MNKRRPKRRIQEDRPSIGYMAYLRRLGPREGESRLAYTKRLAAVQVARNEWVAAWRRSKGDRVKCDRILGIANTSRYKELLYAGLSYSILDKIVKGLKRGSGE